jgi:hypothetical protein
MPQSIATDPSRELDYLVQSGYHVAPIGFSELAYACQHEPVSRSNEHFHARVLPACTRVLTAACF